MADVLLVEGNTRVSTAIKYLTQSTWSHAALYIGDALVDHHNIDVVAECTNVSVLYIGDALVDHHNWENPPVLVEVDMVHGCQAVPLSKYAAFHTRICRPVGLSEQDRRRVVDYAIARLGQSYDLKNLLDLARYLMPVLPVPSRFRYQMLALGSGEPTKVICSTLIAQAFQAVGYPILPRLTGYRNSSSKGEEEKIYPGRHASFYTPRDFDISPYFQVIKPTIEQSLDYRELTRESALKSSLEVSEPSLAG